MEKRRSVTINDLIAKNIKELMMENNLSTAIKKMYAVLDYLDDQKRFSYSDINKPYQDMLKKPGYKLNNQSD